MNLFIACDAESACTVLDELVLVTTVLDFPGTSTSDVLAICWQSITRGEPDEL